MSFHFRNSSSIQRTAHETRAQRKASSYSCYSPQLPCRRRQSHKGDHTLQRHTFALAANDKAAISLHTVNGLSVVIDGTGRQPMTGPQSESSDDIRSKRGVFANGLNGDKSLSGANDGAGHAGEHLPV